MDVTAAQLEIVNSLAQDEIPIKLRCATCNKLAFNAFRLPCCEQAICENCQLKLPENCPVCDHSPLSADLCKPNKALRTTVRVFLKTVEKKLEKSQPTPQATEVPAPRLSGTPAVEDPTSNGNRNETVKVEDGIVGEPDNDVQVESGNSAERVAVNAEFLPGDADDANADPVEGHDQPRPSDTSIAGEIETSKGPEISGTEEPNSGTDMQTLGQNGGNTGGVGPQPTSGFPGQMPNMPNGMAFDMNSGFSGMGWNGQPDYNQMMQYMGGNMGANPMVNFPNMMGMPGFGMDPMTAQSMYGGFGGMGMSNGMNMGMGFNAGQGMYGAWNGQNNMWNGAQDKYNPNAFANSMGNFGPDSGYGYNMSQNSGNFSQMPHQQQFPNNDYQQGFNGPNGRGRGRGRGYGNRGRGAYNQHIQANQGNYGLSQSHPQQQDYQQQNRMSIEHEQFRNQATPSAPTSQKAADENSVGGEPIQSIEDQKSTDEHEPAPAENDPAPAVQPPEQEKEPATAEDVKKEETNDPAGVSSSELEPQPVRSILDEDFPQNEDPSAPEASAETLVQSATNVMAPPSAPLGPAAQLNGDAYEMNGRGRGTMRGSFRGGPRGRGWSISNGNAQASPPRSASYDIPPAKVVEPVGQGVVGAPTGPKAMRQGFPNTSVRGGLNIRGSAPTSSIPTGPRNSEPERSTSPGRYRDRDGSRSRSRSHSRSRSRSPDHRSRRHRHHRHRSVSISESDYERGKRRERKHKRSRRDINEDDQALEDEYPQDSRASTPASSKISSHRQRDDKDRRSNHKHRSSHRSSRHRSRSREHRQGDKTPLTPLENGLKKIEEYVDEDKERGRKGHSDKDRSRRRRDEKRDEKREEKREEKHRDRKRSRRDRSLTPDDDKYSSHRESQRQKREPEPEIQIPKGPRQKTLDRPVEPQKDPHTLEREARNRERMLKEQQRREALNTGPTGKGLKRRESRQSDDGGRRMSYKYEDEESHSARAIRIEQEREAARWG